VAAQPFRDERRRRQRGRGLQRLRFRLEHGATARATQRTSRLAHLVYRALARAACDC
jgi:hypothetical protein